MATPAQTARIYRAAFAAKRFSSTLTIPSSRQQALRGSRHATVAHPEHRRQSLTTTSPLSMPAPPKSKDRGPASKEDTQTDFNQMNILSNTPAPTTGIDACQTDGFALNSGLKVIGSGVMLVGGEAFKWSPWIKEGRVEGTIGEGAQGNDVKGVKSRGGRLTDSKGLWAVDEAAWGVLKVVWPKPGKAAILCIGMIWY